MTTNFEEAILEKWQRLHQRYPDNQMIHDARKDVGLLYNHITAHRTAILHQANVISIILWIFKIN